MNVLKKMGLEKENTAAFFLLGVVFLLIIPLPSFLLDLLLVCSITLSCLVLLLTLFVKETLEFSAFPSVLLFLTLFRLGLNVATTRMILSRGEAGHIIYTFGEFVTGGNSAVGFLLFALLTVINFFVLTKGAGRVAEVSARFTLEALPGKQLLIDADQASGHLNKEEGKEARERLATEAEFYGQMDGASKFVKGDAIASLVILSINLIGGFILGLSKGQTLGDCYVTYTRLTVGDGLVTQIPALLISIASGILLTRGSKAPLNSTLHRQLLNYPKAISLSGLCLIGLGCIPGMPKWAFLPLGALLVGWSFMNKKGQEKEEKVVKETFYPIELKLGKDHIAQAPSLFEALPTLRETIAQEWGVRIPSIHITDDLGLPSNTFLIKIKGVKFYGVGDVLEGSKKAILTSLPYLVTRHDLQALLEGVRSYDPLSVKELEEGLELKDFLKIVQNLLKERLSIEDASGIVDALVENIKKGEDVDVDFLTEKVRQKLLRKKWTSKDVLHAITLDLKVEQMISASLRKGELLLRAASALKIEKEVLSFLEKAQHIPAAPVVLTSAGVRKAVSELLDKYRDKVSVYSYEELTKDLTIKPLGFIPPDVLI